MGNVGLSVYTPNPLCSLKTLTTRIIYNKGLDCRSTRRTLYETSAIAGVQGEPCTKPAQLQEYKANLVRKKVCDKG